MATFTTTFSNAISSNGINSFNTVLATARTGSNLGVSFFLNTLNAGMSYSYDGANYTIVRNFFHFDTSSIPTNATIISAFLRLPGTNTHFNNTNTDTIVIVESTVSTNTTIATSDWTNFNTTTLGSLALASYNQAANNDLALNATGLTKVVKGGYSKFAIVTSNDIAATTPTGYNNATATNTGLILSVTYSVPEVLSGDFKFL